MDSLILIPFLIGPIFLITGIIILIFPPKNINSFYGYRTTKSRENQESWNFAQTYFAKEVIKVGVILLLSSTLGLVFNLNDTYETSIGLTLILAAVIILIRRVENALTAKFDTKPNQEKE